jgi:FemAB-related protein (PEP-CTERM system-associated)
MTIVHPLNADRVRDWDDFVARCPTATFFHRAGWRRVVEEAFGHKTHYLFAEKDGRITGVLPIVHIASRLFGNGLVSNAFGVYGGPAVSDPEALAPLDAAAAALMDEKGAGYLEYRSLERLHPDWPCKDELYVTFRRPIDPDREKNLKAIPRKQRAVVRQALERPLAAELDPDTDRFFAIYAQSVRNLGTPVFSPRYFRLLKEEFGEDCQVMIVSHDGMPVTALISFFFRDEVLPYYAGGLPEARKTGAFDFMYWRVICDAAERGIKTYDFGRSKVGTGHFAFKKNWGFTPQPIFHEYRLPNGGAPPDVNPLNPKYQLFIAAWKRLPLAVANRLGPLIARDLG